MISCQNIKIIIVIVCLLLSGQVGLAQQSPTIQDSKSKPAAQTDSGSNSVDSSFQPDSNEVTPLPEPPSPSVDNNSAENQTPIVKQDKETLDSKSQSAPSDDQSNNPFNSKKPEADQTDLSKKQPENLDNKPSFDKFIQPDLLKKKIFNIDVSTLLAILGLLCTFLGLSSTWFIYHLNKKNNDPLMIDKKHSGIKYVEELYKIKNCLNMDKISKLDIMLNSGLDDILEPSKKAELTRLLMSYGRMAEKISSINLMEMHSRYQKHMNQDNEAVFKSLLSQYTELSADSKLFTDNSRLTELLKEENIGKLKDKIIAVYSFEKKIDMTIAILTKELKS